MKNYLCFIGLILCSTANLTAGGPWTQVQGKGYFKLSEWWIIFDQHYTDNGKIDPNVTTGIFNTFLYAEYGVTNRLTAMLNGPLLSRNYMNNLRSLTTDEILVPGEGVNSLGDLDLGFKYRLTKPHASIPVAASLILGFPTGKAVAGSLHNLQTGDGEFNQMIRFDAGLSIKWSESIDGYLSTYVGLNHRTEGFSEEFRYGMETGASLLNDRLWLVGRLFGLESFKNGDTAETITSTSIFANNTEYTSISVEVNYYLTRQIGVSANVSGAFRGEIIAAAPSYSVGFFLDL